MKPFYSLVSIVAGCAIITYYNQEILTTPNIPKTLWNILCMLAASIAVAGTAVLVTGAACFRLVAYFIESNTKNLVCEHCSKKEIHLQSYDENDVYNIDHYICGNCCSTYTLEHFKND